METEMCGRFEKKREEKKRRKYEIEGRERKGRIEGKVEGTER